ncbi:MAG: DEAD/DEAH box helicase [Verrucomicrobiota bacterium]
MEWKSHFDSSEVAAGKKAVGSRLVSGVEIELLETGDAELKGVVADREGGSHTLIVAIWREGDYWQCEGDGQHAAALFCYLAKAPERVDRALGACAHEDRIVGKKHLEVVEKTTADVGQIQEDEPVRGPSFFMRLERRPEGERSAWLPEIVAQAYAVYEGRRVPLSPAGHLPPVVLEDRKVHRSRSVETEALQALYALDLLPGAEEPPQSLKKLAIPAVDGTLWAPNEKEWPHAELYWQRFRHEAVPALERRGWEIRFAPDVGYEPLIFRTEAWKAEMLEEGKGWFHLSAGFEIDGEPFELQPILAALVRNRFLEVTEGRPDQQEFMIFLPDGRGLALPVGRFRRLLNTLGELLNFNFTEGPIRLSALDAARIVTEPEGDFGSVEAPPQIEEMGERLLHFERIERKEVPQGIQAELRSYQLDGYWWMQFLVDNGLNGILADDMGLGKTLQSLTHLGAEIESGRHGGFPSLVVAPTSVVMNWQREAAKFYPDLEVLVLQGAGRQSQFCKIPQAELVLTSYALLHRDLDSLKNHEFHLLILDEAQHIKNRRAQVSQAVRELSSRHRVCLSGTPVENHLGELWSLMDFLMPGLLGSDQQFREAYQTPIEKNESQAKREALASRIGPLILRRTKHDVAKELPPKTEMVHEIEMSEAQKDLYETVRSTMDKQVRQALAIRGQEAKIMFLDALLKLRQICCHPDLLKEAERYGAKEAGSAKFEYLVELLTTLREEGHRVLLFSQFTSMLSVIETYLERESIGYLKLTGGTSDRQGLVERFQGGEGEVFLISLKAGGTGLTLTGADTVIHYDPWWNPAAENQATDRAYRIGQDKAVMVHKLICRNTVEERIQQMQERKGDLSGDVLSGATSQINLDAGTMEALLSPDNG